MLQAAELSMQRPLVSACETVLSLEGDVSPPTGRSEVTPRTTLQLTGNK